MINRVVEFRKKKKLSQAALAKKSGISRPYLSAIENGNQERISNVVMLKIASALDETVTDIFFHDDVV